MRKPSCLAVLLAVSVGCAQMPLTTSKKVTPLAAETGAAKTPSPVTADQINELNARSKAHALQEELERAALEPKPGAEGVVTSR